MREVRLNVSKIVLRFADGDARLIRALCARMVGEPMGCEIVLAENPSMDLVGELSEFLETQIAVRPHSFYEGFVAVDTENGSTYSAYTQILTVTVPEELGDGGLLRVLTVSSEGSDADGLRLWEQVEETGAPPRPNRIVSYFLPDGLRVRMMFIMDDGSEEG